MPQSAGDRRRSEAPTAPARSREATRRRLVDAGTELFALEGLHGVTSARIARRAGVATGTFYLHFRDKRALFQAIVFEALEELRRRQQEAAAATDGTPAEEVRARTEELLRFAEEQRDLVRVLFGREAEAGGVGQDVLDAVVPGIERRLRERVAAGEVSPELEPAVAAQALAAMTTRVVAWWVERPERASRASVVATLLRMHPILRLGGEGEAAAPGAERPARSH